MTKEKRKIKPSRQHIQYDYSAIYKAGFFAVWVAVGVALYWFWAYPYRAALSYREEMQLFQTTWTYFNESVWRSGGMADYTGEFLTQFFNNYWMGAGVMVILTLLLMWFCYRMIRDIAPRANRYSALVLALLPAIGTWLFYGIPDATLSTLAGLVIATGIGWLSISVSRCRSPWIKIAVGATASVLVYCMCGPIPLLLTVAIGLLAAAVGMIPWVVAVPALVAIEVAGAAFLYPSLYDAKTYRLIDYDYLVRINDWDGILRLSDKHEPDMPMTVSATNLALGMKRELDSRAFQYYQHGAEGLIPPFVKETLSSWITGEIFFQLGMTNSAQRFCFEGMEAIPSYRKSVRAIKRLAETAVIRGEYTLAKKYLRILENTLFYRNWARRNLELIKNPEAIDSHPLYGTLRKKMIDEDYLFSEGELDKTFGQLFLKNTGNDLARQYLVVYPLLQRDLEKFSQYMGVVVGEQPRYNPLLAQQALAFMHMKSGQPIPAGMVPPAVEESLRTFARAWTSKDPLQIEMHKRTLYYYLVNEEG